MRLAPGAYPQVENLKGASFVLTMALSTSIRLSWKSLPGTHRLANYKNSKASAIKNFITLVPGAKVMKLFSVMYGSLCKARVFVRLGWKSLPMTNTLAYYENP